MDKRERTKDNGFVGVDLTLSILEKLDAKVQELKAETGSGSRSAVIRLALIEYLK